MLTAERNNNSFLKMHVMKGDTWISGSTNRCFERTHQIFDRASERTQERSSFPSRPAENGWSTSWSAELSDG